MISVKYALFLVAAFAAGSFLTPPVQQAIAAVIATDVQCTGCVGNADLATNAVSTSKLASNSVNGGKVADQSLSAADLGPDSVGASELKTGAVGYAEVSKGFIAIEHRPDCNCGGTGWDPDGTTSTQVIFDDRITSNSVISVTATGTAALLCATYGATSGLGPGSGFDSPRVVVRCTTNIPEGASMNYALINSNG